MRWGPILAGLGTLFGLGLLARRARASEPVLGPLPGAQAQPAGAGTVTFGGKLTAPPITVYKTSPAGVQALLRHEGKGPVQAGKYRMYDDPNGHCTVGVGHLIHRGRCIVPQGAWAIAQAGTTNPDLAAEWPFKDGLTEAQLGQLLVVDLGARESLVRQQLQAGPLVPVTQAQFDVLVSYVYNRGSGNVDKSGLWAALRAGDYAAAAGIIGAGPTAGLPGLIARRAEEQARFTEGIA